VAVSVIGLVTFGMGFSAPANEIISGMRYAFLAAAVFAGLGVMTASLLKGNQQKLTVEGKKDIEPKLFGQQDSER